ncbi:MAG: sulfatase/phosphatase domain-containing protein, partial [Planctomycetota bacterium]
PDTLFDDYQTRSAAAYEQELSIGDNMTERDLKIDKQPRLTDEQRRRWQEAYAQRRKEWKNKDLKGKDLVRWKYQAYMQDYLRCVAGVDESIGRLLDYLEKSGLEDNTMVVYTSDQGFFLGNHGWFDKRFMYEEPLHMPFMVRYPGEIEPGSRSDEMVLNLDFAPTFLDAAGVDVPDDMQGRSFMPMLKGETPDDWRTSMYYHYYEYPSWHMIKRHYGVRTKRYKLIHFYYDQEAWELYDLKKDPNETNNVVAQPEYQDVRRRLQKKLKRLRRKYGETVKTDWQNVREYLKEKSDMKEWAEERYGI